MVSYSTCSLGAYSSCLCARRLQIERRSDPDAPQEARLQTLGRRGPDLIEWRVQSAVDKTRHLEVEIIICLSIVIQSLLLNV